MQHRVGAISNFWLIVLVSLGLFIGLGVMFRSSLPEAPTDQEKLVVYCAAGVKKPMAAATKGFEEELGIAVELRYGGSGTLLTNLQNEGESAGDLYLAADTTYIELARKKGLLDEAIPVGHIHPVIAVRKGNPKKLQGMDDLLREDISYALANPEAASIGKLTKKIFEELGRWDEFKTKTKVFKPTVNDIVGDVTLGSVDAAIIWDANARQQEDLDFLEVPEFQKHRQSVTIGVLKTCDVSSTALKYARYLQAPEKGQIHFKKYGYETVEGDRWSEHPSITLFSGGVNRLAVEKTIEEFEKREGVEVIRKFNGCGILVALMNGKEGGVANMPDAYFACDQTYLTKVEEKFQPSTTISETDMVLVVHKENPHNIQSLKDLTGEGIKVGLANEKQSALGKLTADLLHSQHLYEDLQKNVVVNTPTADLLVNDMIAGTGGLDAVIVYRVNVSQVKDKLKVLSLSGEKTIATQPIAIAKTSQYPYLTQRLIDSLQTAKSQERFLKVDFRWLQEKQ